MRFRLPGIFLLGLLLALAGTQDASAQKLEIVLQSSNLLQRAGRALVRGQVDEAAALYEEALGAGVSEWETYKALNNLCVAQYLLEDYEAAIASCKRAIRHRANRWMAYSNLGLALSRLGRYEDALKAFRRGLEVAPRNRRLRHNLEFVEKAYRDGRKEGIRPARTHPRSRGIV